VRLAMEGFQRDGGGAWHPSLVCVLIRSGIQEEEAGPQMES